MGYLAQGCRTFGLAVLAGLFLPAASCRSTQDSRFISVNVTVNQYGLALSKENQAVQLTFGFPSIEGFNGRQQRVLVSKAAYNSGAVLKAAPALLRLAHPAETSSNRLRDFVDHLSGISSADRKYLIESGLPLVVVASMDGCEACTVQDHNLDSAKASLLAHSINVLSIHVAAP